MTFRLTCNGFRDLRMIGQIFLVALWRGRFFLSTELTQLGVLIRQIVSRIIYLNAKLTRFNTRFWKPKVKKDPVTSEMSQALLESKITDKSPLRILHLLSRAVLITRGFLRFSELYHIKPAMLSFSNLMCPFFLESSTCAHFRDGAWIVDWQLVPSRPWRSTSRRLKSNSPRVYRCAGSLLLLGQKKKKHETKGLAIQGLENSLRTPLDILRTVRRLVLIALGLEEPLLRLCRCRW